MSTPGASHPAERTRTLLAAGITLGFAAGFALRAGDSPADLDPAWPVMLAGWGAGVALLRPAAPDARLLLVVAALARALVALRAPVLSDDVWRYVWEGRVWLAGHHPFVSPPDAPELEPLRDAAWARVNHRAVSSIYPPLAHGLFVLLAPFGARAWQLIMGAADVVTARLLHRRRPEAGWLWALCPLPILETASSGHLEGLGVLLFVAGLAGSPTAAWTGAMVKLLPGVLLVPLLRGRPRAWPLVAVATAIVLLPLALGGPALLRGFETYRATWAFNAAVHPLVRLVADEGTTRLLLLGAGAALTLGILTRSRDPGRVGLWVCGAFVVLSPTVHPWYVLWPWAAALWTGSRAWTLLAVLVPLAYAALWSYDPELSRWVEPTWPRWVTWPPFFVALAAEAVRRLTRPNPAPVH